LAHPEGLEPPTLGSEDRRDDLTATKPGGFQQYQFIPRWPEKQALPKFPALPPGAAEDR